MRLLLLSISLLAAVGCGGGGGASPELYAVVFNYFTAPDTCYQVTPTTKTSPGPLGTLQVEVWDGPESKAFLVTTETGISVPMGDAPDVDLSPTFEGASSGADWTFVTDQTSTTTFIGGTTTVTKTHAALTFPRAGTGKGTLSLSSSRLCTGGTCPASMPSCGIDSVPVRTTRLAVDYLKVP